MIAYLKLIRLPNAFTSIADILAGGIMASAASGSPLDWRSGVLALSSAALYLSGMAFNDFADRREDAHYRPDRPIPSGKVSPLGALLCAIGLMLLGVALAASLGTYVLYAALPLATLILLYNFGSKNIPVFGALTLGACRFFNTLLGLAAGLELTPELLLSCSARDFPLAPALIVGLYAAGITAFSAQEEKGHQRRASFIGWLFTDATLLLAVISVRYTSAVPLFALLWLNMLWHSWQVRVHKTPRAARNMIRAGVKGICILDAALILGFAGQEYWPWAIACASLILPGTLLALWLSQKEA